jgi:hypothetical protein
MIQVRSIRIRKWFPPNDRVATVVAMLCVLREDLVLEYQGIVADDLEVLDCSSRENRTTYFWRNSLRTLEEIKSGLNAVNAEVSFREALAKEPLEVREAFERLKKELNKTSHAYLRDLRNTVGAHLVPFQLNRAN